MKIAQFRIVFLVLLFTFTLAACVNEEDGGELVTEGEEVSCNTTEGYYFDPEINACVRQDADYSGEEIRAVSLAIAPLSYFPVTITQVEELPCVGCYDIFFRTDTAEETMVIIRDWQIETESDTAQADGISSFAECVAAGNPVMESFPRQCEAEGEVFVEQVEPGLVDNADNPRNNQDCPEEYAPVCGEIQVQCVTTPCDPVQTTFENECWAEVEGATNIQPGPCEDEVVNLEGACLAADRNWIADAKECEGMAKSECLELGGVFDSCASACRNNPEAEICTQQCVQVCQF